MPALIDATRHHRSDRLFGPHDMLDLLVPPFSGGKMYGTDSSYILN